MAVRIAGYASLFGVVDHGGDIVRAGAFRRAVRAKGVVPLLWQHDAGRPIGRVERLAEDKLGLRVIAELAAGSRQGDEAVALLRAGAIKGLSFGYRVRDAREREGGGRELLDLDLIEVSVVTFPMQPLARVHAVEGSVQHGGTGDGL